MENNNFIEELRKDAPELESEDNILPLKRDGLLIRLRSMVMDGNGKQKFTQITINSHPFNVNDSIPARKAIAEIFNDIYNEDSTLYDVVIEDYESLESFVEGEKQKNSTPDFKNPQYTARKSGLVTLLGTNQLSSLYNDLAGPNNPLYQSLINHLNLDNIITDDMLSQDEAGYLGCFSYSNKDISEPGSNDICDVSNFKKCDYFLNEDVKHTVANILNNYYKEEHEEATQEPTKESLGPCLE